MAFEVTTKREVKKFNLWNIVFAFSLIILIAAVLSFFIFSYYIEEENKKITDLENKITKQKQDNKELESRLQAKKKLIDDFSIVLNQHKLTNQAFAVIEKITHPEVFFAEFSIEPENYQISLSAITTNFQTLGEQMIIFKNNNEIADFDLLNISLLTERVSEGRMIKGEGYVQFDLDIFLSPQVFIFNP